MHATKKEPTQAEHVTHHPEVQRRRLPGDDEPEPAVAEEVLRRAHEEHRPRRQRSRERAGDDADVAPDVLGDGQRGHLPLVVPEAGLEHWRDGAEEVADAGHGLHPHCSHQHQPSVPAEGPQPLRELPHGKWE